MEKKMETTIMGVTIILGLYTLSACIACTEAPC